MIKRTVAFEPSANFVMTGDHRSSSDQTEQCMTRLSNEIGELSADELETVSGGRINLANFPGYHGPTLSKGGTVGGGDTIDGIPWGGAPGDGSWGIVNNNLPGGGPWGN